VTITATRRRTRSVISAPQSLIDRAIERDPANARAEYLAEFRTDIESFVSVEAVLACVQPGLREVPPDPLRSYSAFVDPSGGSSDSMTMGAIWAVRYHILRGGP
jgi:hypothetical protein